LGLYDVYKLSKYTQFHIQNISLGVRPKSGACSRDNRNLERSVTKWSIRCRHRVKRAVTFIESSTSVAGYNCYQVEYQCNEL
jgi:hypothetical protein